MMMMMRQLALSGIAILFAANVLAAELKAAKPAAKEKAATKGKQAKAPPPLRKPARTEKLACKTGTEDRHARIALEHGAGKVWTVAYYSIWKPRTCSILIERTGAGKWSDSGSTTTVGLDPSGTIQIETLKGGEYRFTFKDVDKERNCQMEGMLNGTLTIKKGQDQCVVEGLMEDPPPLGTTAKRHEEDLKAQAEREQKFKDDLERWKNEEAERESQVKAYEKYQTELKAYEESVRKAEEAAKQK
jgi:hypothetical protein